MQLLRQHQVGILVSLLVCTLLACDATFSAGFSTATAAPPPGTATITPPSLNLTLTSVPYNENTLNPPSTITALIPQLVGGDDPRVTAFNQAMSKLVQLEIDSFKMGLTGLPNTPQIAISTFDVKYNVIYEGGDLWSIKFDMNFYVDEAAHPGDSNHTITYDFAHSKTFTLDDLFLPDSKYLQVMANYSARELATRDIAFNDTTVGAEPTPKNYRNWNITPNGLLITFERGQVAAYAAPAQLVLIPYAELKNLINLQGPLSMFMQ